MLEWSEALDGVPRRATLEQYLRLSLRRAEIQIQKEQQKVEQKFSNFDPIDGDLPGLIPSKLDGFEHGEPPPVGITNSHPNPICS